MDQDLLNTDLCWGGFYTVYCLCVYLLGRRVAPKLAIRYSIGCWVGLVGVMVWIGLLSSIILLLILFVVSLIVFPAKVDTKLQAFFTANRIYKATTIPEQVSNLLGSHYYSCAEATITTQSGQDVCFNWWQGLTSSVSRAGNAYVNNVTCYLAISFRPNTVSEAFKQLAKTKADTSGFTFRQKVKRVFVLDTDTPIAIKETEDGSFVIIWQTHHDVKHFINYINWLKTNLSGNKPIENSATIAEPDPTATPDLKPAAQLVVPASSHQHGQALGVAPKIHLHSRR